jgi:hypothetical protein
MSLTLLLQQLLILLHILCILINSFCFSERNKTGTCQLKGFSMANKMIITDTPHSLLKNKICSSLYSGKEQEGTNSLSLSLLVLSLVLFFAPSFLLGTEDDGSLSLTDSRLDAPNCTLIKWFIYQTSSIGDFYIFFIIRRNLKMLSIYVSKERKEFPP